jgi:ubiquinol-cytochrome c reductase cytochrome b subunit
MRLFKRNDLLSVVNGLLVDLPAPSNLNFLWNFGSLLGLTLVSQLLTGIFLVMRYTPNIDLAFLSIERICRDVFGG